jgi:hypothetical protein
MPAIHRVLSLSRLMILVWVISWVATAPLFHTHVPDINDGPSSRQALAHTVFSPDLPGEFSYPHNGVPRLSSKSSNSPEVGFVLSTDSKSPHREKPSLSGGYDCLPNGPFHSTWVRNSLSIRPRFLQYDTFQGLRAPPLLVSL